MLQRDTLGFLSQSAESLLPSMPCIVASSLSLARFSSSVACLFLSPFPFLKRKISLSHCSRACVSLALISFAFSSPQFASSSPNTSLVCSTCHFPSLLVSAPTTTQPAVAATNQKQMLPFQLQKRAAQTGPLSQLAAAGALLRVIARSLQGPSLAVLQPPPLLLEARARAQVLLEMHIFMCVCVRVLNE